MHIAFYRSQHNFAFGGPFPIWTTLLFFFDKWHQMANGLLHDPGAFDHLGQEHFAATKQVADNTHAIHERPFDNLQRVICQLPSFFSVGDDKITNAFHQGMA